MTSQASDPVRRTSCATDQLGTGMPGVATSAPAPTGDSAGKRADELKAYCVAFFRWWHNQPGSNTEQGYDTWAKSEHAPVLAALRQPPQPTGDVEELERRASKFSARWGNSNPSVATMMAAFAIEEVKSANSRLAMPAPCYLYSGPHESGYRVVVGFKTIEESSAAHAAIINAARGPLTGAGEEGEPQRRDAMDVLGDPAAHVDTPRTGVGEDNK